jgi:hypothetical protein
VSSGLLFCELHAHTTWSDGYLRSSKRVYLAPFAAPVEIPLPIAA